MAALENISFPRSLMATLWAGILFFLFAICPPPSGACTLFTAKGSMVGDRGVLIAKNRDNSKNLVTELRFVAPEKGFRFLGLFDPEADGYVVSGINEKGLTVVNASATSLPDEKRNVATEDLTDRILTTFSSVDGVLHEEAMFAASHPAFYILADTAKIDRFRGTSLHLLAKQGKFHQQKDDGNQFFRSSVLNNHRP